MNVLVFSDTHLTDRFDQKKYDFLMKIILRADQVIINGDFWDGYVTTFDRFIESPWKNLFLLLKSKNTRYLFGNHDKKHFSDERISQFCTNYGLSFDARFGNKNFHFEHGNRLLPYFEDKIGIHPHIRVLHPLHRRILGFLICTSKKKYLLLRHQRDNKKMKQKLQSQRETYDIFICGHTHLADVDRRNRFINTGLINYGLGQYLTIENGTVHFHEEWYE